VLPGWTSAVVTALGSGAGWPVVADVPALVAPLGDGWLPGAAPGPLQAAVRAQAAATADAAARARHRFLPRCTPRL